MILYRTEDGRTRIECRFEDETIWLSQLQLAELFQTTVANINLHLKSIYEDGEADAQATIKSYLIVRSEGDRQVSREVLHYSLPAILSVGYRVRSPRGTQFRQWATARLEEFLVKGFVLDDERLKNPPGPGVPDYFDELLERIRDIRASERRMYLRVRDILALATDYDPREADAQRLFQVAQNKLIFAATGKTAPELIAQRADASAPNMGLTTWKGDVVRKADVTVSKNYLHEDEIGELNRIVVMFLDFAEDQARRRKQIFIRDWEARLDDFLRFNERAVLANGGAMSRDDADRHAHEEYARFEERRRHNAEVQGEVDAMRVLEDAGRSVERLKKK
ncbi:MAG: virulence RhuM family protein [Thermoanaerobaculia bacterium]